MKTKTIIDFEVTTGQAWGKGIGNRQGVYFCLVAELPDAGVLYAATIDSDISKRYPENQAEKLTRIMLLKQKESGEKYLHLQFTNGKMLDLREEDFFILLQMVASEDETEDFVLIYNKPCMIGKGAHHPIFHCDGDTQDAVTLFWILKDFVAVGKGEA